MLNHQGSPVLFTQRLRLRPYRAGDGAQMFSAWAGDAQVTKYMGFSTHADSNVTERLAQLWVDGYESPTVYRWGVEYQGELAGDISVVRWNEEDSWCELGCCIARKYWNQGLMTRSADRGAGVSVPYRGLSSCADAPRCAQPCLGARDAKVRFAVRGHAARLQAQAGWHLGGYPPVRRAGRKLAKALIFQA